MTQKQSLQIFEDRKIRTVWDSEQEKWYFSIVDTVEILTESKDATAYWRKLKQRLKAEGNETVTNCHAFKMRAIDGKMRLTDVADTEQLFRLIQSRTHRKKKPQGFFFFCIYSPRDPGSGFFASKATASITSPVRTAKEFQRNLGLFFVLYPFKPYL